MASNTFDINLVVFKKILKSSTI